MKELLILILLIFSSLPGIEAQEEAQDVEQQLDQMIVDSMYLDASLSGTIYTYEEGLFGETVWEDKIEGNMRYDFSAQEPILLVDAVFDLDGGETVSMGYYMDEDKLMVKMPNALYRVSQEEYDRVKGSMLAFRGGTADFEKRADISQEEDLQLVKVTADQRQDFLHNQMIYFTVMYFDELYSEESVDAVEVTYVLDEWNELQEIRYHIKTADSYASTVFELTLDIHSIDEEIQIFEFHLGDDGIQV